MGMDSSGGERSYVYGEFHMFLNGYRDLYLWINKRDFPNVFVKNEEDEEGFLRQVIFTSHLQKYLFSCRICEK